MEIPDYLESQTREGRVVLFLGAGASGAASSSKGDHPPNAARLGEMLADKFLGGKYRTHPLNQIAEYAISESDLGTIQAFIRDEFERYQPSPAHLLIPRFWWYGLATTNYDRLIEKSYETAESALQELRPLIENTDRIDDNLRQARNVLLLKLHGCVTRSSNPNCQMILTVDQYVEHRKGRDRLFATLQTWAYDHPIVFIGHSLQDSDIRAIVLELTRLGDFRPRYYVISPDVDEIKSRYWETKKITALRGTFDEFMRALDTKLPSVGRNLASLQTQGKYPIAEKFKVPNAVLSRACAQFLETDVDYVRAVSATETLDPLRFYRGFSPGFSAIEQQLDVRRELGDTILSDYILRDEQEPASGTEFVLIKAHAGAGKSVLLKRIAWDAARDYSRICLFLKPTGVISSAALQELISVCKERVFLFVDDAADRVRELQALAKYVGPEGNYLTVILAERINEWNVQAQALAPYVTDEYELKYLSSREVGGLIDLLAKNRALGTLEHLSPEQRREALSEHAGRQLLVALHEATLGKPFEDILIDEYNHVTPMEAQRIYLTVCVLNRLNVPVRAGIIARIHGIPFEDFRARFLFPLEHVVLAENEPTVRDYVYRARHPHIADIVFLRILGSQEERFDLYLRCLQALNIGFAGDWKAFWQMVRGRTILELFPNHDLAKAVYGAAKELVGEDPHLLHQMGIYEMHRPNGNLQESASLLERASELASYDLGIKHSMAELKLRMVDRSRTELEKEKLLKEASQLSYSLLSSEKTDSYAYHTLAKVGLKRLQDAIARNATDLEIQQLIKDIEESLFDSLQRFPGDPYLLETEAQLAAILSDSERVRTALEKAFASNPRSSFVALRLAFAFESTGSVAKARDVLERALAANSHEPRLHCSYAKLLLKTGTTSGEELIYHLKRSFTDGDSNYDAQLLHARQLYMVGKLEDARVAFKRLSTARIDLRFRSKLLYPITDVFEGRIIKMEASYCFIARDGFGDWVYVHASHVEENVWRQLTPGSRVRFQIAFSMRGPSAFEVGYLGGQVKPEAQMGLFKKAKP